jgi:hypothetical protein
MIITQGEVVRKKQYYFQRRCRLEPRLENSVLKFVRIKLINFPVDPLVEN